MNLDQSSHFLFSTPNTLSYSQNENQQPSALDYEFQQFLSITNHLQKSGLSGNSSLLPTRSKTEATPEDLILSNSHPIFVHSASNHLIPNNTYPISQTSNSNSNSNFSPSCFSQFPNDCPPMNPAAYNLAEEPTNSVNEEASIPSPRLAKVESPEEENDLLAKGWTEDKDTFLLQIAAQYRCDWKKISRKFGNKKFTPHFLKIRYKELTDTPVHKKVKFSHYEDLMLAKYFKIYGSNWNQISTHFKNRTGIMLKNRYYSHIRKRDLLDTLLAEVDQLEKGKDIQSPQNSPRDDSTDANDANDVNDHNEVIENEIEFIPAQSKPEYFLRKFKFSNMDELYFEMNLPYLEDPLHSRITPMIESFPSAQLPFIGSQNFQANDFCVTQIDASNNNSNTDFLKAKVNSLHDLLDKTQQQINELKRMGNLSNY